MFYEILKKLYSSASCLYTVVITYISRQLKASDHKRQACIRFKNAWLITMEANVDTVVQDL